MLSVNTRWRSRRSIVHRRRRATIRVTLRQRVQDVHHARHGSFRAAVENVAVRGDARSAASSPPRKQIQNLVPVHLHVRNREGARDAKTCFARRRRREHLLACPRNHPARVPLRLPEHRVRLPRARLAVHDHRAVEPVDKIGDERPRRGAERRLRGRVREDGVVRELAKAHAGGHRQHAVLRLVRGEHAARHAETRGGVASVGRSVCIRNVAKRRMRVVVSLDRLFVRHDGRGGILFRRFVR